jgi:two-component system sensor kinase FixL
MNHQAITKKAPPVSTRSRKGSRVRDTDLRTSYEFSRTLLQSGPYPVLVTGLDTSVQYVNPAFENLTGFTSAEVLGQKSPYPWWPPEKIPEYERANLEGRKIELNKLERYYQKKNGEVFWVAIHIAPVKYEEETRYFIANWVDFTERKRAEEALQESEARFRMLSENSLAGIFIVRHGRLSYVNPAFAVMLGRPRNELVGCIPSSLVHPEDWNRVNEAIRMRLRGEQTNTQYNFRCLRGDGKIVWLEALSAGFEDQRQPALLGTVLDITEQRQAEEEVDRLRQVMAHVSRVNTLGELAASLAHELNQPLTAIMANARTALRIINSGQIDIAEIKEILEDVTADDKRAGDIIRRMREPLKRGQLTLELLDVNNLIGEIYQLVRNDATIAGVTIDMKLAAGLPKIRGDRTQLQQVLLNLLVNALDAVKERLAGQRWIEVRSTAGHDRLIRVEVSDSGPGIPEINREHLFEPLRTTKTDGLGVGLSISKHLIEDHGGRIWQENRSEGGARFIFTLPVEQDFKANKAKT